MTQKKSQISLEQSQGKLVAPPRDAAEAFLASALSYPGHFEGRGIVICVGGSTQFTSAWVGINLLRFLDCDLPVQLWHRGRSEFSPEMEALIAPLGVECIDARTAGSESPCEHCDGWTLRPFALLHSPFQEVLLLDADCLPLVDPGFLFRLPQFREHGALLWPAPPPSEPDDPEFDEGQLLVDKERCWHVLQLALWQSRHQDYHDPQMPSHIDLRSDLFRRTFVKLMQPFARPSRQAEEVNGTALQYAFDGTPLFQHGRKWDYFRTGAAGNQLYGRQCRSFLDDLRRSWDGEVHAVPRYNATTATDEQRTAASVLTRTVFTYDRVGYDCRLISFSLDGTVGLGYAGREQLWNLGGEDGALILELSSEKEVTCRLRRTEGNEWQGQWLHAERMLIHVSPADQPATEQRQLEALLPATVHREVLLAALEQLPRDRVPVIVEIGTTYDALLRGLTAETDGWSSVALAAYAAARGAELHMVDLSPFHIEVCRRITRNYAGSVHFHVQEGVAFLAGFERPIDLLLLDAWDEGGSAVGMDYASTYAKLAQKPHILMLKGPEKKITFDQSVRELVMQALADGYQLQCQTNTHTCLVRQDTPTVLEAAAVPLASLSEEKASSIFSRSLTRISPDRMFAAPLPLRVVTHDRGDFRGISGTNVLIYWPHGVGDWVFLSYVLPFLDPSNRYWVVRFGDDSSSVFEGSEWVTPIYLGHNSPNCGNGRAFHNQDFNIDYNTIDGSVQMASLPLSLYEQCRRHGIDTLLWSSHPEVHGFSSFPYHTKGRYLLPYLAEAEKLNAANLGNPLHSAINLDVSSWLVQWVMARLQSKCGFGARRLCLIARNGYTGTEKNWGYLWRDEMPEGKRREGEECRDFMRLLLAKDPNWLFLVMEDRLFDGSDTVRSEELHAYSYAEVFGVLPETAPPFGLILKALINLAALAVGVPTGPFHLSMIREDLPTVGIWLSHLPSWYDEPKPLSRHLVSQNVRQEHFDDRPGSFFSKEGLHYSAQWLTGRVATGEEVLAAVEDLLY